jgi:hypothetical protein
MTRATAMADLRCIRVDHGYARRTAGSLSDETYAAPTGLEGVNSGTVATNMSLLRSFLCACRSCEHGRLWRFRPLRARDIAALELHNDDAEADVVVAALRLET